VSLPELAQHVHHFLHVAICELLAGAPGPGLRDSDGAADLAAVEAVSTNGARSGFASPARANRLRHILSRWPLVVAEEHGDARAEGVVVEGGNSIGRKEEHGAVMLEQAHRHSAAIFRIPSRLEDTHGP
jgi:hypothetical protein